MPRPLQNPCFCGVFHSFHRVFHKQKSRRVCGFLVYIIFLRRIHFFAIFFAKGIITMRKISPEKKDLTAGFAAENLGRGTMLPGRSGEDHSTFGRHWLRLFFSLMLPTTKTVTATAKISTLPAISIHRGCRGAVGAGEAAGSVGTSVGSVSST